ncbi:MAG: amidohydrolase family protein [Verrucomicrobiota bacterium]
MKSFTLVLNILLGPLTFHTYAADPWIIDPHTHFKGEEQIALESIKGKPHPKNSLGHVVVPEDYRKLADRLEIQSTLITEAIDQDQPQFNDWILKEAQKSDLVCGYTAREDLASPGFLERHERYVKTNYLNGYRFRREELGGYLSDEIARKHLGNLEEGGFVIDLLIDSSHAPDAIRLAQEFPNLKIVINHCFRARMTDGKVDEAWLKAVKDCAAFPNVFMKISSILNFAGTKPFVESAPDQMEFYLPVLDPCFEAFGEDRVIFASNWGVSAHFGRIDDVVRIVKEFLATKGEAAVRKGMRENALRVYGINEAFLR